MNRIPNKREEPQETTTPDVDSAESGHRIQVALAEFSALRSELDAHTSTQSSLFALVVTAIGIVAGLVIKDGGDARLLLILPVLVAAAGIHHAEQSRAIKIIGSYIRDRIWPYLGEQLASPSRGFRPLPSWEKVVSASRRHSAHKKRGVYFGYVLSSAVPAAIIFVLGSVVPLVAVQFAKTHPKDAPSEYVLSHNLFDFDVYRAVWWLGAVLTLVYIVLALSTTSLSKPLDETLTLADAPAERSDPGPA